MESWLLLEQGDGEPGWNMACDQWLLLNAHHLGKPVLRIYGWIRPSVSIGYFQPYPSLLADKYSIVRRPTGGGLVFHDSDLTFTMALPPGHPWKRLEVLERYARVHERVARIFEQRNLRAELSAQIQPMKIAPNPSVSSHELNPSAFCFEKKSRYDVIVDGKKVAGGAQRVTRSGLIHQGSILTEKRVLARELKEAWETCESRFETLVLNPSQTAEIDHWVANQFGTLEWNRKATEKS